MRHVNYQVRLAFQKIIRETDKESYYYQEEDGRKVKSVIWDIN